MGQATSTRQLFDSRVRKISEDLRTWGEAFQRAWDTGRDPRVDEVDVARDAEILSQLFKEATSRRDKTKITNLSRELRSLLNRLRGGLGSTLDPDLELKKAKMILDLAKHSAERATNPEQFEESVRVFKKGADIVARTKIFLSRSKISQAVQTKLRAMETLIEETAKTILRGKVGLNDLGAVKEGERVDIAQSTVRTAAKAARKLFPQIEDLYLVGSRLRHKYGRDIDFVAVVNRALDLPGRNITDLAIGRLGLNLFFALPDEVEPTVLEFGLGMDVTRWKRRAIEKGYKLNRFGLWSGPVRVTNKLAEIAYLLDLQPKSFLFATLENPL